MVDIFKEEIYGAEISIEDGLIVSIDRLNSLLDSYLLPGLIDSHIHIESSMLTPQNFGRIAISHGTLAVVSDPHEIANVLGVDGVKYMIENASKADLRFFFGVPSCVPATDFETSGGKISSNQIESLFENQKLLFLSEVMNYPGVIFDEKEVHKKIDIAKRYNKRIDGHAPGLTGQELKKYVGAGIETDHECSTIDEATEKINLGMKIQIREGSAAKNFDALWPLIDKYPNSVFLCSDDLHPDDLLEGHINMLLAKGVKRGINLFNLIKTVTLNPNSHYGLNMGMLRVGDGGDFIRVDNIVKFDVSESYIKGQKVFDRSKGLREIRKQKLVNRFKAKQISPDSIIVRPKNNCSIKVISVTDGELVTKSFKTTLKSNGIDLASDITKDILKLVVLNRYEKEKPAIAYIHNFGLKKGAIASSIAHDSHNIIAVGVNNDQIAECINWIVKNKGGVAVHNGISVSGIPLPIAGIMSDQKGEWVAEQYLRLNNAAADLGSKLKAPFMTLSFMSLLVIPELKLSNKGLFDGVRFEFTDLFEN